MGYSIAKDFWTARESAEITLTVFWPAAKIFAPAGSNATAFSTPVRATDPSSTSSGDFQRQSFPSERLMACTLDPSLDCRKYPRATLRRVRLRGSWPGGFAGLGGPAGG